MSPKPKRRSKTKATRKSARRPFRFLWITDPWDTLDHPRDTTLRLAQEALLQGVQNYWCDVKSLRWENGEVRLDAQQIIDVAPDRGARGFTLSPSRSMRPDEFSSIHYRVDPPVDLAYLQPLQLLMMSLRDAPKSELVNPGQIIGLNNEKLEAGLLDLMPPSLAASQWDLLEAFGRAEGRTVLKPLHQAQSKGIELLDWNTPKGIAHARKIVEQATENFSRPVLLQRYLIGINQGEKRLWFVDGKLLACIRKLPLPNDFRVNLDRGSELALARLTASELKTAAQIGKHLKRRHIRLAAIDLIDGFVTDFNFTSPGLITQMEKILNKNLARVIISKLLV